MSYYGIVKREGDVERLVACIPDAKDLEHARQAMQAYVVQRVLDHFKVKTDDWNARMAAEKAGLDVAELVKAPRRIEEQAEPKKMSV